MSYKYVIDSSAWIEYFGGSYERLKDIIEHEKIATSVAAIAEIVDKLCRGNLSFVKELRYIQTRSAILGISVSDAVVAAKIKNVLRKEKPKFGLVDGIHLATALRENAVLVSTDTDFAGLRNSLVI